MIIITSAMMANTPPTAAPTIIKIGMSSSLSLEVATSSE